MGHLISTRRKRLGMTQKQLADRLNVTDRAVSRWERGVGAPDISLLSPLAEALQVSTDELLSGVLKSQEPSVSQAQAVGIPIFFLYLQVAIMTFGALLMFLAFCLRSLTSTIILVTIGFIIFAIGMLSGMFLYRCPLCKQPLQRFFPRASQYQIQRCRTCGKSLFSDHTIRTPKQYLQYLKKEADAQK